MARENGGPAWRIRSASSRSSTALSSFPGRQGSILFDEAPPLPRTRLGQKSRRQSANGCSGAVVCEREAVLARRAMATRPQRRAEAASAHRPGAGAARRVCVAAAGWSAVYRNQFDKIHLDLFLRVGSLPRHIRRM